MTVLEALTLIFAGAIGAALLFLTAKTFERKKP